MKRQKTERKTRELRSLLALTMIPNLGSYRIRALLDAFSTATAVFEQGMTDLRSVYGVSKQTASRILAFREWDRVNRILNEAEQLSVHLFASTEPDYPAELKEICDPPPLLWARGNLDLLKRKMIAVVGTRRPDRYGREQAHYWASAMSDSGLTVVSGLAYGIDRIAHQAAAGKRGRTVAVLPGGINRVAPAGNRDLARSILDHQGLLITECLPDTKAFAASFPKRNRIISGLTLGTIVIQSGIDGGSMITARTAVEYGREVFVVPHSLDRPSGSGNHELIRDAGGKLIETPKDVFSDLKHALEPPEPVVKSRSRRTVAGLTFEEQQIGKLLADSALPLDSLVLRSGTHPGELLPLLLDMEMRGLVRQRPGRLFEWAGEAGV